MIYRRKSIQTRRKSGGESTIKFGGLMVDGKFMTYSNHEMA